MDDPAPPAQATSALRYHESMRVAWLITWRQTVIVMLAVVLVLPVISLGLVGLLTTLGVPAEAVNWIGSLIPLVVIPAAVQPILFLMAMNKEYRGFRIEALREDGQHEDLTLTECIAPSLMLWVGGTILLWLLFMPILLAAGSIVGDQVLNFLVAPALQVLFAYPVALLLLFRFHRARFHSFRFHVVRDAA